MELRENERLCELKQKQYFEGDFLPRRLYIWYLAERELRIA